MEETVLPDIYCYVRHLYRELGSLRHLISNIWNTEQLKVARR